MKNPLITVIIPTHNNEGTINTAVNSMRNQTYKNLEIIVVDDNSTDNTKGIIFLMKNEDSRIKYFELNDNDPGRIDRSLNRNVNAGYSARNYGFSKANGELVTFQDGDDASLLNRIEIQYKLLTKYDATHITTNWLPFSDKLLNTVWNGAEIIKPSLSPNEMFKLSQKTKGLIAKISNSLNSSIPFHFKRLRIINKLFFGSLEPYPGAGNSPLFKREVIEKVKFRNIKYRIWPSFMGRGADRDFNFQVAETFKNSYFFEIPLYLWRK